MKLWIVGKVTNPYHRSWLFAGVFDSKEEADKACLDETYFMGATKLNQGYPDPSVDWEEGYFPRISSINMGTGA